MKNIAVFLAGFIAGRVTSQSNSDKLISQLSSQFELSYEQIEFIRNAFSDPKVVQEFFSLSSEEIDSTLEKKFKERLKKIRFFCPETESYLSSTAMNITQKRRRDIFWNFVLDHSDSELVEICDMLRKRKTTQTEEESITQYDEKMKAFHVPDPNQTEEVAYTIFRILEKARLRRV